MSLIDDANSEQNLRIVYCGPAGAGKRTNLKYVFDKYAHNARQFTYALETGDEVTVVDFLVTGDVTARVRLCAPGCEATASESLREVLTDVDGVVFVVDSQVARVEESIDALGILRVTLAELGLDLDELPFVMQFNKLDLPDAARIDRLQAVLNPKGGRSHGAVAVTGVGVFDCIKDLVRRIIAARQIAELELLDSDEEETDDEEEFADPPPEAESTRLLNTRSQWRSVLVSRGSDVTVELQVPADLDYDHDEAGFRKAVETFRTYAQFAPVVAIDFDAEPARVRYAVERGRTLQELRNQRGRLEERATFAIGLQLASALAPLSDAGVELGHFTTDTIWVADSGKVTLLFAGTAQVAELIGRGSKHQHRSRTDWSKDHARCDRNGQAPETYFFPPTPRADIFRLGVVLHDCLSGAYLLHGEDAFSEGTALRAPAVPAIASSCDALLRAMIQRDPEARLTVAEVTSRLAVLLANDARSVVRALVGAAG